MRNLRKKIATVTKEEAIKELTDTILKYDYECIDSIVDWFIELCDENEFRYKMHTNEEKNNYIPENADGSSNRNPANGDECPDREPSRHLQADDARRQERRSELPLPPVQDLHRQPDPHGRLSAEQCLQHEQQRPSGLQLHRRPAEVGRRQEHPDL